MTKAAMEALQAQIQHSGVARVFIGDLPETQLDCIALRPVAGYPSTLFLGMPATLEPLVEVLVRAVNYETGQDMYMAALTAVNQYSNADAGIRSSVVVGSPGYLGRNTDGFGEWHFVTHLTLDSY